jgi:hypothetical protein
MYYVVNKTADTKACLKGHINSFELTNGLAPDRGRECAFPTSQPLQQPLVLICYSFCCGLLISLCSVSLDKVELTLVLSLPENKTLVAKLYIVK